MAKTSGEIFVGIFSDYELLANISMTSKYVLMNKNESEYLIVNFYLFEDQTRILKQVIFFDMYSVIKLIWVKLIMLWCTFKKQNLVCNHLCVKY
jgi:hypothetical protein